MIHVRKGDSDGLRMGNTSCNDMAYLGGYAMLDFPLAPELKKHYRCYGHFYELELPDGSLHSCRSVLEIINYQKLNDAVAALAMRQPDTVIIMMNPGSSRPLVDDYQPRRVRYGYDSPEVRELVLTMPDTTQYQVMRLMHVKGWQHVRVLNLSDLRDTKSANFVQTVAELAEREGGRYHSIFCDQRLAELQGAIRRDNWPLILAWGQVGGLQPLARMAKAAIQGQAGVGVEAGDDLYAHPSPMLKKHKVKWLTEILEKV